MLRAIELSMISLKEDGGPFGCVIVKNNEIISEGFNEVTNKNDPTAHAEIVSIRNACNKLNTFNLKGTQMFTSCEPCPMCLSAIYWARIERIFLGNTKTDAAAIGFDDNHIYREIPLPISERAIPTERLLADEAITAFRAWETADNKIEY